LVYDLKVVLLKRKITEENLKIKKLASYSHRTATTARPCYIPVLGDSAGAGRIRLARGAKVCKNTIRLNKIFCFSALPAIFVQLKINKAIHLQKIFFI